MHRRRFAPPFKLNASHACMRRIARAFPRCLPLSPAARPRVPKRAPGAASFSACSPCSPLSTPIRFSSSFIIIMSKAIAQHTTFAPEVVRSRRGRSIGRGGGKRQRQRRQPMHSFPRMQAPVHAPRIHPERPAHQLSCCPAVAAAPLSWPSSFAASSFVQQQGPTLACVLWQCVRVRDTPQLVQLCTVARRRRRSPPPAHRRRLPCRFDRQWRGCWMPRPRTRLCPRPAATPGRRHGG